MERDLHDAVKCSECGALLYDEDFEKITWNRKTYWVCPHCLAELLNTLYAGLSDGDIREIRRNQEYDD